MPEKTDKADKTPPAPPAPPGKTAEQLQAELDAANAVIATLEADKAAADADEQLIQARMAKGLNRAQAVAVVKRQKEYDASAQAAAHRAFNAKAAIRKQTAASAA